ncbi:ELWxxDGT repeat protein [Archangium lipolyticum]|uniref:ELWxxDGT repeat protein n=1 Tax=Archangium lipolyticum TaxID=2970465 RepID=UPI002149EE1B|nr:ELWxxDGT repeat protein [Archangium lipolyticum]
MMMQPALTRLALLCLVLSACAPNGGADSREPSPARRMSHDALSVGDSRPIRPIRDIHPAEDKTSGSSISSFIRVGSSIYFYAVDAQLGSGLWRTDGTEEGTVRLVGINTTTHGPGTFTEVDGLLYFAGESSSSDSEPWRSDGTPEGTFRLADIQPGSLGSYPKGFVGMAGAVYFFTDSGTRALWRYDPATGVTTSLRTVCASFCQMSNLVVKEGRLYFAIKDDAANSGLWSSDGTEAGTVRVSDAQPAYFRPDEPGLVLLDDTLYFLAREQFSSTGYSLWRSDGTVAGTRSVLPLDSGNSGQRLTLIRVGGALAISVQEPSNRWSLWWSNGTAQGTVRLKEFSVNSSGAGLVSLTAVGDRLFFVAADVGSYPYSDELWHSDGTVPGTVRVKQLKATTSAWGSAFRELTAMNGVLYFVAEDPSMGLELWRSDGTERGTVLVRDIDPRTGAGRPSSSEPRSLSAVGDTLYFTADDGHSGHELWKSQGQEWNTVRVKDIFREWWNAGAGGSNPRILGTAGGLWFFHAYERMGDSYSVFTNSLWRTDGTEAGTFLVMPLESETSTRQRLEVATLGSEFFVALPTSQGGVWKTAGAATEPPVQLWTGSYPEELEVAGGQLFFSGAQSGQGDELWRTDGTPEGTRLVKDLVPGSGSSAPSSLTRMGEWLYFAAQDEVSGRELWRTDGTSEGTSLVADLVPGSDSSSPSNLTAVGGTLFFVATKDASLGLWRLDGAAQEPALVSVLAPSNPWPVPPNLFTAAGSQLFFVFTDATHGAELWVSDGTPGGTRRVRDIRPGTEGSQPKELVVMGGLLFFTADDGVSGRELWRSDGTEEGTFRLVDASPGTGSGLKEDDTSLLQGTRLLALEPEGLLLFSASTPGVGNEPWLSDGTREGTRRLVNLFPGPHSSLPRDFVRMGNRVAFAADDGRTGREPWLLEVEALANREPPTLTCPEELVMEALQPAGAPVSFPVIQAHDDVTASPTVTFSRTSGGFFPLGTTEVTATASDEAGNQASCTFQVTVRDTTPPAVLCPGDVTVEGTEASGAHVDFRSPRATDGRMAAPRVTLSAEPGSLFGFGSHTVTATATDGAGNTASCSFVVTVSDTQAPSLACPDDLVVEATSPEGARVDFPAATASDGPRPAPSLTSQPASGSTLEPGIHRVTVTATDVAGLRSTCSFRVTVQDTTAPRLTCPEDTRVEATSAQGTPVSFPEPTAVDTVSEATLEVSHVSGALYPRGITRVSVSARDEAGNTAVCRFTVTVQDTTAPEVTCPEPVEVRATAAWGAQVSFPDALARDGITAAPTVMADRTSGDVFAVGEHSVTFTARDEAGNTATCSLPVRVLPGVKVTAPGGCSTVPVGSGLAWSMLSLLAWLAVRRRPVH